ncbi:MAG TPA: ATPase, partial [Cyanobacteria bacterium UBA8530]|nr:ATPase [Cyanobacteria bacterium UBA8530]
MVENNLLEANEKVRQLSERFGEISQEIRRVIVGQQILLDRLMIA